MKYLLLKSIAALAGVGAGIIVAGFSLFLLLLALAFLSSGSDVGFEIVQILGFALLLMGGAGGVIAGGLVFIRPGISTGVFSAATVFILVAAVALMEFSFWSFAPALSFGVGALISRVVSQRRLNPIPE